MLMRKFTATAIFCALLLSCGKDGYEGNPGDAVEIGFSAAAVGLDFRSTRAAVYIPNTRTVRIVVRKSVSTATAPDLSRPIVAENTYYVNGAATSTLTPCTVNATTLLRLGNGTVMTLPPGYYDIYAYSPAIPLDDGDKTMTTVRNNMDFMATAAYGVKIEPAVGTRKATVNLPTMQRLCSAIGFADLYNNENLYIKINNGLGAAGGAAAGRQQGIFIDNIYKVGKYVQGAADLTFPEGSAIGRQYLLNALNEADGAKVQDNTVNNPKVNNVADYTRLGTGTNVGTGVNVNMVYNKEFYVMAGAANNAAAGNKYAITFDLKFYSAVVGESNDASHPLATPLIDGASLKKGVKTSYNIKVESGEASKKLVITSTIVPWDVTDPKDVYID